MKTLGWIGCFALLMTGCGPEHPKPLTAQDIVDRAIEASGGERYTTSQIAFDFRDYHYEMKPSGQGRILKRSHEVDSGKVTDILQGKRFQRLLNGSPVKVPDSMAIKYSNSINSVHYFAYLPYGLNDPAVNKELLGEAHIGEQSYYKMRITFDRHGGGKDYKDVYIYWFNKKTFVPDYLAYLYHVDGGGLRFRKAYNERQVGGIRFVDYKNYQADTLLPPVSLDSLYQAGKLELLSDIRLRNISVNPGSYN